VIVAALLPLTLVALHAVGGISGLENKIKAFKPLGTPGLHAWRGLAIHHVTNPLAPDWVGVIFGLGFMLSFGYWTTNFAEVQRALSAKNLAAFMAGVAANVTSFNTVVTYDLIQAYFVRDHDPVYFLRAGRLVTIAGILISVLTAFIAKGYSNIMNYIQTLFSIFNAPLFATFIIAMFWKRASPWGGFWSLIAGTHLSNIRSRARGRSAMTRWPPPATPRRMRRRRLGSPTGSISGASSAGCSWSTA
jgi:Na+/proline symporter